MGDIFSLSEEARKEASPKTVSRGVAGLEESDLKVRQFFNYASLRHHKV